MMILALSLILFGALFVLWSTVSIVQNYMEQMNTIEKKQNLVSEIADHSNEIILRARGYYVYLSDYEYEQIFTEKDSLYAALVEVKKLQLSDSELEVMRNIEDFFDNYFANMLPQAIEYAQAQNYEALREFVSAGADNPVNKLILYAHDFEQQVQLIAKQENEQLIKDLSTQAYLFIGYIVLMLVAFAIITRKIGTDMGAPLRKLTKQARRFAEGERFELESLTRIDEIGELSRSLQKMMGQIHIKEETLLAQNEELQAQQQELQAQQEELQYALSLTEANEHYLKKRNQLIQSLSNTLNEDELLNSIIHHMVEISGADKGLLVMLDEEHAYASIGISETAARQFIADIDEGITLRALQTHQAYTMERVCTPAEQGYHEEPALATDFVLPIVHGEGAVVACLVLTKLNWRMSPQEKEEIIGLTKQISLSFDKLLLYEQSERQRLMTSDMLNTIQEGIQFLSLTGTTLEMNGRMNELLGLPPIPADSNGISLEMFLSHLQDRVAEPAELANHIRAIVDGGYETSTGSVNYEINQPERRFIQMYGEPLYRNGKTFGLLLVHRDITKEHEVDRMKTEFVSTVSHELRTPLASVLGFAELLLHRELKPERQRKYMMTIHQEAKRLTTLINDFLDLQRMESGKQSYEWQTMYVAPLIQELLETQELSEGAHRFEIAGELPQMQIWADYSKMRQVFVNLLSNAVKYSPSGGAVKIRMWKEGEQVAVSVSDEGLGIPAEALPQLFNKFYRVDNTDRREIGGTGLGLAIVKEIVTRHRGSIDVSSEFGQGSTFTVRLPMLKTIDAAGSDLQANAKPTISVMLVENDFNLSVLLQDELTASGYQVTLYTEARQALAEMENLDPDIAVVDLMLEPSLTGWDIVRAMKQSEKLSQKPIIISSAFEEQEKAAGWGISDFLVKPYVPGKLSERIDSVMNNRRNRSENENQ